MSRSGAGLVAVVCILVSGMTHPRADDLPEADVLIPVKKRRPIAVIELGDIEANRQLARELARELNDHPDLKPIDSSTAANVLGERFEEEDAATIIKAEAEKRRAEEGVLDYRFPEAARAAENGLGHLHSAIPSPKVLKLSAELAFLFGVGKLGQRETAYANLLFRFARTLDASFKPDPIRFLPVVQAFEAALKATTTGTGWIGIKGDGQRILLDGRDLGPSPQTLPDVAPGIHTVWLAGSDRDTHAQRVVVKAGEKVEISFEPGKINDRRWYERARVLLKQSPDPTVRAARIQALASRLGVKDAVLLTEANGKTIIQTWREGPVESGTPGFSALTERKPDDKPADILKPFLPPKVEPPPRRPDPPFNPPFVDTRSWYEKPRYQIAGGAVGVVVIGIVIYALASWERKVGFDTNPGFDSRLR